MDHRLAMVDGFDPWSGLVRCDGADFVTCLAHGQKAQVVGRKFEMGQTVMLYEMKTSHDVKMALWTLTWQSSSVAVPIPAESDKNLMGVKDICAGMGGISQGLEAIGFCPLAAMDSNPLMCETLLRNGHPGVIQGNVLRDLDRALLHCTPSPMRCTLVSGFPCQPLSSQGDQRGQDDERSRPFHAVLKTAWEQQCAALILENVKGARTASYVQEEIQKLAWSLSMDMVQTYLNLSNMWPCRRSRWWMLMAPKAYQLHSIPDLPEDKDLQLIRHLFRHWPQWTPEEEEALQLSEMELATLRNPIYGADLRQLTQNDVCPCFLHSYSTVFQGCPCGCRLHPFSAHRLLRDGVRGFYLISMVTGAARWVHPREAALFCGLNPQMQLPNELRAALCLVGQCASPLQAAWIGSHLLDGANGSTGTPLLVNTMYKMWLLRQAHGMCPKKVDRPLRIIDDKEGVPFEVKLKHSTKVGELLAAEERLHGEGQRRALQDLYGQLHESYDITNGAISGDLTLQQSAKKQRKIYDQKLIQVVVQGPAGVVLFAAQVPSGTQVFEVLHSIPKLPQVYYKEIRDEDGNFWRLDERIRSNVTFVHYRFASDLFGAGSSMHTPCGLGNECIDREARRMLAAVGAFRDCTWIPAAQLTWMMQDPHDVMVNHWLVAALHGVLRGCAVIQHHWLLMELTAKGNMLSVTCWDGLDHCHRQQVIQFAEVARQKLVLRTRGHIQCRVLARSS